MLCFVTINSILFNLSCVWVSVMLNFWLSKSKHSHSAPQTPHFLILCFAVFCFGQVEQASQIVYGGGLNIYNLYGPCVPTTGSQGGMRTKYDPIRRHLVTANFGWAFSELPIMKAERQVRIPAERCGCFQWRLSV